MFADLTARGVLKKAGAWYVVLNFEELPKHAWSQAVELSETTTGGKTMIKLKFKDSTKWATALRRKIVGS